MVPRATTIKIASHIRTRGMFVFIVRIPFRCILLLHKRHAAHHNRQTHVHDRTLAKEFSQGSFFRRLFAEDPRALQKSASYQRSHRTTPLHSPISCLCRPRTAKVAVTTDKTSGLRMAVKSISTYTDDLGAMVSMFTATLPGIMIVSSLVIGGCCVFQSNAWGMHKDARFGCTLAAWSVFVRCIVRSIVSHALSDARFCRLFLVFFFITRLAFETGQDH